MMDGSAASGSSLRRGSPRSSLDGACEFGVGDRRPAEAVTSGMDNAEPTPKAPDAVGTLIPWSHHAAMATNGIICSLARRAP